MQGSDRMQGGDTLLLSHFYKVLGLHFEVQMISLTLLMTRECDNTSLCCTKCDT